MVMVLDSNIDIRQVKSKLALFLFWKIFICQISNTHVYVCMSIEIIQQLISGSLNFRFGFRTENIP
jgi:hypothetical protein